MFEYIQNIIITYAGTGVAGYSGDGGAATSAQLNAPTGIFVDTHGNLYIADQQRIRMVNSVGIITTFAGTGTIGNSGDGGAATSAQFNNPSGMSADISGGNIYIADRDNSKIRMVNSAGIITTFAGTGVAGSSGDGGAATSAQLHGPTGVTVDNNGNLYIVDPNNRKIRMVTSTGIMTTFAGTGVAGSSGDGGKATSAQLNGPSGVGTDSSGNVYIVDNGNNKIRMVTSTGIITTFAGTGTLGYSGDGGSATSAELCEPQCVATDVSGNVYISDYGNNDIRLVTSTGIITTFAGGNGMTYSGAGNSGDGGVATSAKLFNPLGVAVDIHGNVYISDHVNNKIRMVFQPQPTTQVVYVTNIILLFSLNNTRNPRMLFFTCFSPPLITSFNTIIDAAECAAIKAA